MASTLDLLKRLSEQGVRFIVIGRVRRLGNSARMQE
jgi:hypothetical protein